jgi:protein-S-isoprenylcysteine O-methyltransferase Ste14
LSLALLGTAIAVGEARGPLGAAIAIVEFKRKSLVEERFMSERFGAEYEAYRGRVKALAPGLW